ncbi:MAG: prepilin-type N-terminal cleavage/methylation domain-containing protein [Cyanobacteria bacterium]|nr:prepilin-type N-terminal cleavage/methylation domain-containing protein [Cyanobacteriota bacterium]
MTTNLKARLLQHFLNKKTEGGFTLIELLVVIIIIGILSAIALPSFLNQASRAKETEANTYIGSLNRGQQAYRLENNSFATDLNFMEVGVSTTTEYYAYTLVSADGDSAEMLATSQDQEATRDFRGCVALLGDGKTTSSIEKEDSADAGTSAPACP